MSAAQLVAHFVARKLTCATAESCTGGLVAAAITAIPGASSMFTHGFVTYANEAKTQMLGVPATMLAEHGAVSEPVARAMAEGARARAGSDYAISTTGIAGPEGGSPDKPVGTVWFGLAGPKGTTSYHHIFQGDREAIRAQAVRFILAQLEQQGDVHE